MEKYMWINPERIEKTTRHVEGMDLTVALSPYDTPKAIVGNYLQDSGQFVISFQYIDDEKPIVSQIQHGIQLLHGKYSGKLLKVVIPIDNPPHDETSVIRLRTEVLDAIRGAPIRKRIGRMNRAVTKEIIEDRFAELATGLGQD
jgi:hypothetical protein